MCLFRSVPKYRSFYAFWPVWCVFGHSKYHQNTREARTKKNKGAGRKFLKIRPNTRLHKVLSSDISLLYCFILAISLIDIQFIRVKYLLHPCKINLYISDRHQPFPYFILFISLLDIVQLVGNGSNRVWIVPIWSL